MKIVVTNDSDTFPISCAFKEELWPNPPNKNMVANFIISTDS